MNTITARIITKNKFYLLRNVIYKSCSIKIRKSKKNILEEYNKMKPKVIYENGLRKIEPYEFQYQSYIKERWIGKKILEVLQTEFKKKDKSEFLSKIELGQIKVNNTSIDKEYIFKKNDFLSEISFRRENPIVYYKNLQIIHDDKDFLVINKPNSWPVQGCSGYQFNTLLRILKDDYNYNEIKTVHRIDKDTSGVVILAKTDSAAESFNKTMNSKSIDKTYICRIRGNFEYDNINVMNNILTKSRNDNNFKKEETKPAETYFEKIFFDEYSNTSVLKAKPKTGRTHQIRIHLQHLGYPIANDPWYGGIIYNDFREINFDIINSNKYCFRIWLHSLSYIFDKYEFRSEYPEWANKEYKLNNKF